MSSTFDLESDDGLRRVVYLSAFLLFFMPYFQAFAGLWPFQVGALQWRFQASGNMSGILMLPFLGLALALFVARPLEHKGVTRLVGVVALLTAVCVLLAMGLFAMDAIQLRRAVQDRMMPAFNKAVFTASISMFVSLVLYTVLGVTAFRSPKTTMLRAAPKSTKKGVVADESVGLLIGQDYTK